MKNFLISNKDNYFYSIQALRAIAFLAIFTYHCGITPGGPWGVSVFFVISGFCMYFSYRDKCLSFSVKDNLFFAINKIKKLYPLHLIMIAVVIIRESIENQVIHINLLRLSADSLLITSWIPSSFNIIPYNGVSWCLSTALFCYFMFSYVARWLNKERKTAYLVGNMIVLYAILFITMIILLKFTSLDYKTLQWLSYEFPIFRLGDFILGCCIAKIFIIFKDKMYHGSLIDTVIELISLFFVLLTLLVYGLKRGLLGSEGIRNTVLIIPSALLTVTIFAKMGGYFTKFLTNKIALFIANISASGFLVHQAVIYSVKMFLFGDEPWKSFKERITVFLISFVITVILALIYNKLINKYFQNVEIKRKLRKF